MKKTYMQPAMLVVKTNAVKMICASLDGFNKSLNTTGDVGEKALGKRRRGIFQDDSEEDQSIW